MVTAKAEDLYYPAPRRVRVRRVRRFNKKKFVNLIRVTGLLLCLMTANTLVQALLAQTQQQLHKVENEIKEVEKIIGHLQYDLANLSSSGRIETIALNNLGMKPTGIITNTQLAALSPPVLETPEITLYMQGSEAGSLNQGVMERIAGWLSGVGRTLAGTRY